MTDPFRQHTIENWAADFCLSEAVRGFAAGVQEYAGHILGELLLRACEARGRDPADLEQSDLAEAYSTSVAQLPMPDSVRPHLGDLCAAFLGYLQAEGRLADGRRIGLHLRAMKTGPARDASGRRKPERRPGPKVALNEPCPCGSGRKFKKCCRVV